MPEASVWINGKYATSKEEVLQWAQEEKNKEWLKSEDGIKWAKNNAQWLKTHQLGYAKGQIITTVSV